MFFIGFGSEGGATRTLFETRAVWGPKTTKKVTCQVTAQNVPGFSEDKIVYAVSNRKRKTTIITGQNSLIALFEIKLLLASFSKIDCMYLDPAAAPFTYSPLQSSLPDPLR